MPPRPDLSQYVVLKTYPQDWFIQDTESLFLSSAEIVGKTAQDTQLIAGDVE